MVLAPIVLFVYNRPLLTQQTLIALNENFLSKESELFIFSDGSKSEKDSENVLKVRSIINNFKGFKSITVFESGINKGLANSIIEGVSVIIKKYGKVIVLEDDLITSFNFLNFMNQALNYYSSNNNVFSISGFSLDLPSLKNYDKDFYIGYRASSWGWGTWSRSWVDIDWDIKDYNNFCSNNKFKREFSKGGSDLNNMLKVQMKGKIDSWAIRWCYNQHLRKQFTIFPSISKVRSIGYGETATHTKSTKRFDVELDKEGKVVFKFEEKLNLDKKLVKEFRNKFSILSRLKDKIINFYG